MGGTRDARVVTMTTVPMYDCPIIGYIGSFTAAPPTPHHTRDPRTDPATTTTPSRNYRLRRPVVVSSSAIVSREKGRSEVLSPARRQLPYSYTYVCGACMIMRGLFADVCATAHQARILERVGLRDRAALVAGVEDVRGEGGLGLGALVVRHVRRGGAAPAAAAA